MKSCLKRIFLVIGIIAVLLIIFIVTYGIRASSAMKKMTPIETGKIINDIYAIKDSYVNLFLIKGQDKYILIDAGNEIGNVEKGLQILNINPNDVLAIFLTHSDFDHIAAIEIFKNAQVYLSKNEEQMINGEKARFYFIVKNNINTTDYALLSDRQKVNIDGIQVQGISNPGHTLGAMSYLINNNYLFTGDALKLIDGEVELFYEIFNMDSELAHKSIDKLMNIEGVEYLFTAHTGLFRQL